MTGKMIIIVALFAVILILGLILRKQGSPYNKVILGVHKIVSVGLIVFIAFHHYSLLFAPVFSRSFNLAIAMCIAVVALFISGAILSAGTTLKMPLVVVHRIFSIVLLGSVIALLFWV